MAESVLELGKKARAAALEMAVCGIEERNNALLAMADALIAHKAQILAANERDIKAAKEKGLKGPRGSRPGFSSSFMMSVSVGRPSLSVT